MPGAMAVASTLAAKPQLVVVRGLAIVVTAVAAALDVAMRVARVAGREAAWEERLRLQR